MHPDLKTLIDLQQVDAKIADLTSQIDALPSQIATLEAQLNKFLHAHEDRKQRLSANQKERRDLEGEIQSTQAKISKHKEQLYQVKTNEQYRAMLKEIEGEEANIRGIEDRVLEKMVEGEEVQKNINQTATRLEGEKARVAAETRRLDSIREACVRERDGVLARRKELATSLSERVLELYERLRRWRHDALALVREGACAACNFVLRPQFYNEVRTNEALLECENCRRILYYVEPPAETGEDAGNASARAAV